MISLDKALSWFVNGWVTLVVILNIVAVAAMFWTSHGVWEAIGKVQDTYSPLNIANWIVELISLSPAVGAMIWRDRRRANGTMS